MSIPWKVRQAVLYFIAYLWVACAVIGVLLHILGCTSGNAGDVQPQPAEAPLVDFTQYWPHTPGTVYEYQTTNYRLGGGGTTVLTLGQPMMWCDTRVLPWIFTKVTINAYWGPGAAYDLIWMITYGPSAYDGYYWSPGGWVFTLGDQYTPGTTLLSSYLYRTNNPAYPPYLLAPKQVRLPYQYDGDSGQNYVLLTQRGCPDPQGQQALPPVGTYDWRVHMAYSANIAPQWLQGGKLEAIRVDYWENTGGGTPMAPWGLRESWYFVKNIGVVRILAKEFGAANLCAHDRDCFAADIQSPHVQVELQSYRTN